MFITTFETYDLLATRCSCHRHCTFYRSNPNSCLVKVCAGRDADGITALLEVLRTNKTEPQMHERALSTLAFLTTSAANLDIVVASNGVATLVPLLGAKSEATALAAAGVLRKLLTTSAGQVGHFILCQARKVAFVFLILRR